MAVKMRLSRVRSSSIRTLNVAFHTMRRKNLQQNTLVEVKCEDKRKIAASAAYWQLMQTLRWAG